MVRIAKNKMKIGAPAEPAAPKRQSLRSFLARIDPLSHIVRTGPLSPALIHAQQQELWSDQVVTFTSAIDRINMAERKAESEKESSSALMLRLGSASLARSLRADAFEEIRDKKGLTQVREDILDYIRDQISFDEGFAMIREALRSRGRPVATWKEFTQRFPDVTATEVSFCALLRRVPACLLTVGKGRIPGFSGGALLATVISHGRDEDLPDKLVASLVRANPQGLVFACDYVNQDVLNADRGYTGQSVDPYAAGGVTGIHSDLEHVPFRADIREAFGKLIVLAISNRRIHERIIRENDECFTAAFGVILRRAYAAATGSNPVVNLPITEQVDKLTFETRKRISDKALEIEKNICRSEVYDLTSEKMLSSLDLFRLIALTRNPPERLFSESGFTGYVGAYGLGVRFISQDGSSTHYSPYRPYFAQAAIQNIHYEQTEVESDCGTMSELFNQLLEEELAKAAGRSVEGEGPASLLEEARMDIYLRHGIDLCILPREYVERYERADADGRRVMDAWIGSYRTARGFASYHTRKIGYSEARLIKRALGILPEGMLSGVKRIAKKEGDPFSMESMMRGMATLGHYSERDKSITIVESPDTPFNTLGELGRYLYASTLLHEVGESIWARLPQEKREEFRSISGWDGERHGVPAGSLRSHFLSPYSHLSGDNDDFSDHFAIFIMHSAEFREAAARHDALGAKHRFIRSVFQSYGSDGDIPQLSMRSIEEVHGCIEAELKRIDARAAAETFEMRMDELAKESEDFRSKVKLTLEEAEEELYGKGEDGDEDDGRLFRLNDHRRKDRPGGR